MLKNHLAVIIVVVAVLGTAPFAIATGIEIFGVAPEQVGSAADLVPESSGNPPPSSADLSDYFQRHPEMRLPVQVVALSDYIQRHPEVLRPGNSRDLSDYYLRHPEWQPAASPVQVSDYFQRHPEVLYRQNLNDLSDWFQRHPESLAR